MSDREQFIAMLNKASVGWAERDLEDRYSAHILAAWPLVRSCIDLDQACYYGCRVGFDVDGNLLGIEGYP